jgi:hypothetical protein
MFFPWLTMSKLPKSDCHPRYKSTSCHLSSISSAKNPTFQCSSFYELHFTYKFIYVFVLQFHDPNLVVQFMYIKSAFDQQIEQVSTHRISSLKLSLTHLVNCTHHCHTSKLFYQYGQDFSLYLTTFLLF